MLKVVIMELPSFSANGREYIAIVTRSRNKNAYARVHGNIITITIPYYISNNSYESIANDLYAKMRRMLETSWHADILSALSIKNNSVLNVMGTAFNVHTSEKELKAASSGKIAGREIYINVSKSLPEQEKQAKAARLAIRLVSKAMEKPVLEKVTEINARYFQSSIKGVRLRLADTVWGSCSPSNSIMLNSKLLFMEEKFMDYVIVHELAHTKHRNHSKAFWKLVYKVIPDYKDVRRDLRSQNFSFKT